jgi:DNA-binding CsgD family transcriptional regulator
MPDPDIAFNNYHISEKDKYCISPFDDSNPYACLLWRDLRRAMKRAKLTPLQKTCFEMWVRGLTNAQIGELTNRDRNSVRDALEIAYRNMEKQEVGTLTVLVETFGWKAVQDTFTER